MPKKHLYNYHGLPPLGTFCKSAVHAPAAQLTPGRLSMIQNADKFIDGWPEVRAELSLLDKLPLENQDKQREVLRLLFTILGCFDIADNPEIIIDESQPGIRADFLFLLATRPDFTLAYMTALRGWRARITDENRATVALRTGPESNQKDQGIAADNKLGSETVKKARQKLAKVDAKMTNTKRGKIPGKKSPSKW